MKGISHSYQCGKCGRRNKISLTSEPPVRRVVMCSHCGPWVATLMQAGTSTRVHATKAVKATSQPFGHA